MKRTRADVVEAEPEKVLEPEPQKEAKYAKLDVGGVVENNAPIVMVRSDGAERCVGVMVRSDRNENNAPIYRPYPAASDGSERCVSPVGEVLVRLGGRGWYGTGEVVDMLVCNEETKDEAGMQQQKNDETSDSEQDANVFPPSARALAEMLGIAMPADALKAGGAEGSEEKVPGHKDVVEYAKYAKLDVADVVENNDGKDELAPGNEAEYENVAATDLAAEALFRCGR